MQCTQCKRSRNKVRRGLSARRHIRTPAVAPVLGVMRMTSHRISSRKLGAERAERIYLSNSGINEVWCWNKGMFCGNKRKQITANEAPHLNAELHKKSSCHTRFVGIGAMDARATWCLFLIKINYFCACANVKKTKRIEIGKCKSVPAQEINQKLIF